MRSVFFHLVGATRQAVAEHLAPLAIPNGQAGWILPAGSSDPVLYVGFYGTQWNWRPVIWAVAIASMVVGAIFGLTQTDVKRILAYSSIAHAGFILVGLLAVNKNGLSSVLFYLLTYGFTTIAAFGLVTLVRSGRAWPRVRRCWPRRCRSCCSAWPASR